ncbi:unnamed protein product, partial [Polarella glacialis]
MSSVLTLDRASLLNWSSDMWIATFQTEWHNASKKYSQGSSDVEHACLDELLQSEASYILGVQSSSCDGATLCSELRPYPCSELLFGEEVQALPGVGASASSRSRSWLASLPQVSALTAGVSQDAIREVAAAALHGPTANNESLGRQPIVARQNFFEGGREEWFVLPTNGACAVTLRLFRPSPKDQQKGGVVTLVFGGEAELNRGDTEREKLLLGVLRDRG